MIWGMFMTVTMESAVFMGKNYLNNCQPIANTTDLTLKQMFDISTRLVSEQDEIPGLETIGWENHSWKYLSLIGDERVINLQRTMVYVFSDSVLCLGKIFENTQSNDAWEQRLGWLKSSPKIQKLWQNRRRANGIRVEYFPGYNTSQVSQEVKHLLLRLGETPENFTGRIIFMSMFNDISCGSRDNENECESNAQLVSLFAKSFGIGQMVISWSWFREVVLYQWRQSTRSMGQYCWKDVGGIRRKRMSNFPCYEPIVQRSTQKQRTWKTVDTPCCRIGNGWDYFSHNCLFKPAQSLRSSRGDMWRVWIPSQENGDPLWWGNRVPHSCWVWSRQKYLWIVMTRSIKIFYCSKM